MKRQGFNAVKCNAPHLADRAVSRPTNRTHSRMVSDPLVGRRHQRRQLRTEKIEPNRTLGKRAHVPGNVRLACLYSTFGFPKIFGKSDPR